MFLRSVVIENFRAIARLEMTLDETTVLIGENGSGKTSLFDALHACLGVRPRGLEVEFRRDHFRPATNQSDLDPIRIVLVFEERHPGEWTTASRSRLIPAVNSVSGACAAVRWEVRARWKEGVQAASIEWAFLDGEGREIPGANQGSIVRELRRLSPFLVFGENHRRAATEAGTEMQSAEQILSSDGPRSDELERVTREVFDKVSADWESLTPRDMRKARSAARRIWRRLFDPWRAPRGSARPPSYHLPSGGAQSLGPLLVFGALLQARGARPLDPDVVPILAAEDFGARLHPSTLGAVRHVLESLPAQKIISTYSGELISAMPLRYLRRMVRRRSHTDVYALRESRLSRDDLRRLGYHIRARRGGALFDRCWLLVEGETEFWLMPEMARVCGYEFDAEGVTVIEFAQCGVQPILELARELSISWHLLADGDEAGRLYVRAAREYLDGKPEKDHITQFPDDDIEHYLWGAGYASVYRGAIGAGRRKGHGTQERRRVIAHAIGARSKPFLAVSVVEAVRAAHSPGVPPLLASVIETAVRLARTN